VADVGFEFEFRNRRFREAQKGLEFLADELETQAKKVAPALVRELRAFLGAVTKALRERHSEKWQPGGSPEDALYRRTGGGIRGIKRKVRGRTLNTVVGEMVIPFPLSVHEEGAVITARNARFLTIPLPAALDNRGVPLRPKARDWDSTFVQRSKRGNLLIFRRVGAGIVPLYLLKPQVTIPPRLGAKKTLDAGLDFFVDSAIDAMAKEILT
jgi:hypothetical protein